jgi:hypothetical protein
LLDRPEGASANWLIHVPSAFFVDMIAGPFRAGLANLPDKTTVEDAATASWLMINSGSWGVRARAGIEKEDACPGLFADVDLSVEISAEASFVPNPDEERIDVGLTIGADASDWDSFRCWLGTGGIATIAAAIVNPLLAIPTALASLVYVSESVRTAVGRYRLFPSRKTWRFRSMHRALSSLARCHRRRSSIGAASCRTRMFCPARGRGRSIAPTDRWMRFSRSNR